MLLNDLQYALRRLARSPGFVAMAVVALALGIGANANIFSFVNAYLLRPLPTVKSADRLVYFEGRIRGNWAGVSYLDFLDWKQQSRAFAGLAVTQDVNPILMGRGEPERILGTRVSADFFTVFTAAPALGRAFLPAETAPGGEPVAILSDGFWQRRFGSNRDVIGGSLTLDGVSHKIVGVMPPRFRSAWNDYDFWAPLAADVAKTPRSRRTLGAIGLLEPGVSLTAAQKEMDTIAGRLRMQYPDTNTDLRVSVRDYIEGLGEGPRESIRIMIWVVAFVLLIACSNVANLQLARATGRAGEIAVRIAIGASRWRIIRQVLIESTLVSLAGGVVGYWLSLAGAKLLIASIPPGYQPINKDFMDPRIVLYTAAVALVTGLVSGIAPALQVSRVGVNDILKEGGRGNSGARGGLRNSLVVVEVTLALVLLLASGLLMQSFVRMQSINPGFRTDNLLTAFLWLPEAKYPRPEQRANFFRDLADRAAALPGVQGAAASTGVPLAGGGPGANFIVEGRPVPASGQESFGRTRSITPAYFQTIGIPLRRGRYFSDQDTETAQKVVIINERLAQQFFPNADPLGQRLKWGRDPQSPAPWLTIVGVVGDVKLWSLTAPAVPEMYSPLRQNPPGGTFLVVRTQSADPTSITPALRGELRALDRDQPLTNIRTMQRIIEESMTIARLMTVLIGLFAGIAMVMAAMGIYGVISYSVAQRTHELGIRMALGAGAPGIVKLVLRQALWMIGIGVALGVPGAAATTKMLQSYLYGVGARDPITFVFIPLALAAVGLLASYIPARRATRLDPMSALRRE